jgi:hypothetical protein
MRKFLLTISSVVVACIILVGLASAIQRGGAGNQNVIYIEMFAYENITATTIHDTDEYQMLHDVFSVGDMNGWTFESGSEGTISAFADGGGGEVTVTSGTHGLTEGDYVTIVATTNYNGAYKVISANTNDFNILATWAGDDGAGDWDEGDKLVAGNSTSGIYQFCYNMTATSAGNNKNYRFELIKNTTMLDQSASERRIGVAGDWGVLGGCEIEPITSGDVITYAVKNTTDSTNLTVQHANVNGLSVN